MWIRMLYIVSMLVTLLIRLTVFLENYQEYKTKQGDNEDGPEPFGDVNDPNFESDPGP